MPVVEEQLEGLNQGHTVATKIEVLIDGEVQGELLDTSGRVVTDGGVTYDSRAAFRGRLDLTVVSEELAPIAPTSELAPYGVEFRAYRGIYIAGEAYLNRLGVFKCERASTDGELTTISANDRGMIVSEATYLDPHPIASGTDALEAVQEIILGGYPDAEFDFPDIAVPLPELLSDEGDNRWDDALGIAKALGCQLYAGDEGEFVITPIPTAISGNPVATIAEGEDGVLLGASRDWDRGRVFNHVTVTGENTSEDDVYKGVAIDENANSPTYYWDGRFGFKHYRWSNEYLTSDDQAASAAQGILSRTIGEPDIVSFEALVDPKRRPWDVVRIEREKLGLAEEHVLDSVTIPLGPDGPMTGSTRATSELEL